ncbi:hypothetical protein C5473_21140 [Leptospira interrogans serovar Weerasinghe]|nr:hypothetical protein C5473_21140 [Leptospira interrogans serovar Weerasinghe]
MIKRLKELHNKNLKYKISQSYFKKVFKFILKNFRVCSKNLYTSEKNQNFKLEDCLLLIHKIEHHKFYCKTLFQCKIL